MRKVLVLLLLALFAFSTEFPFPVYEAFGSLTSFGGIYPSQTNGFFYNPALSSLNMPAIIYTQGKASFDQSGFFRLAEKGKPSDAEVRVKEGTNSFLFKSKSFIMQGRGGSFGYLSFTRLKATVAEGEISFRMVERKDFLFNYSRTLILGKLFVGSTLKYSKFRLWEYSRAVTDPANFVTDRFDLLEYNESVVEDKKKVFWDLGILFVPSSRIMLGVSALDMEIAGDFDIKPQHLSGYASFNITTSTTVSVEADLLDVKDDYSVGIIQNFGGVIVLGANLRRLEAEEIYSFYGSVKLGALFFNCGYFLRREGNTGFLFGIGVVQ